MTKQLTFNIIPSGHMPGETYANIDHGNGRIVFTSETKQSIQSNKKAIDRLIKAIKEDRYRIVLLDLNDQVIKQYNK